MTQKRDSSGRFVAVGYRVRSRGDIAKAVRRRAKAGAITGLGHAAAAIRLTARRSIRKRATPSQEGQPPHTKAGQLRGAIVYAVEKQHARAVIGPSYERMADAAGAHEHGGRFRGDDFPARPFMGPALENIAPRLPKHWAATVR
jgi:phage gpG-like protein